MEQQFHLSEDRLELYALGRVPDEKIPEIEEHLLVCADCREQLDEIGDFGASMREALRTTPVPAERSFFEFLRKPAFSLAVAAALLAVVVAVVTRARSNVAPLATLQLTALRGNMPETAPAKAVDLIVTDAPQEGGPFHIELVDVNGAQIWSGTANSIPGGAEAKIQRQVTDGAYFVRLYDSSGRMIHEYGFKVRENQ